MASPARRRARDDDDDERRAPSADRYRKSPGLDEEDEESPRARRRRERDEEPAPVSSRRSRDKDEDDDPPPRRGRSRDRDEDDDDEPPARAARRRSRDEDENEDEEPPARSSRRSRDKDDDEDDEKPARRGRSRSRNDDEDDEDEPVRNRKDTSGWDSYNKKRKKMGTFSNDLKVPDDDQILIKFLDDEPFASFGQHWITTPKGLRSFTCLEVSCPLCDSAGDTPRPVGAFNVLLLDENEEPQLYVWAAGPHIAQKLEKRAAAKTGPLTKEYYSVSKGKTGANNKGSTVYEIDVVRSRDLKEEWGIAPLRDAELDAFEPKMATEEKYVRFAPRSELKAVAREAMDDED